jgi:hypothetical protein
MACSRPISRIIIANINDYYSLRQDNAKVPQLRDNFCRVYEALRVAQRRNSGWLTIFGMIGVLVDAALNGFFAG